VNLELNWCGVILTQLLLVGAFLSTLCATLAQTKSEAQQLREELRQLKQDCQQPIDQLEERLRRLEGTSDCLWKITLPPQVSLGNRFFSRPVIRAFVSYAGWGVQFRGQVGGNHYATAIHGLTYGVQMEVWW
jgi:hypothetical protein